MARKYTRDNRGRFASTGATARGGRLRTAGGGKRERQTMKAGKRAAPDGAIRATDVGKAKVHNFMSKMVEKNQDRYDKAAIERGRTPRQENKTTRLLAAQSRISQQKRAVRPEPPKVTGRRGQAGATSRIRRGKITQPTLMGGKATTYGRARFAG